MGVAGVSVENEGDDFLHSLLHLFTCIALVKAGQFTDQQQLH